MMQLVNRRRVLVGVAAFASLLPGVSLADSEGQGDQGDDGNGNGNGNGRGFAFGQGRGNGNGNGQVSNAVRLRLVQVSQVNGGTGGSDFSASNPGGDGLSSGSVFWMGGTNAVMVNLRGATANSGYDVAFERLNDNGREDLGTVTTDGNGNFTGQTPNGLGGNGNRIGTFVLNRGGQDQFVGVL